MMPVATRLAGPAGRDWPKAASLKNRDWLIGRTGLKRGGSASQSQRTHGADWPRDWPLIEGTQAALLGAVCRCARRRSSGSRNPGRIRTRCVAPARDPVEGRGHGKEFAPRFTASTTTRRHGKPIGEPSRFRKTPPLSLGQHADGPGGWPRAPRYPCTRVQTPGRVSLLGAPARGNVADREAEDRSRAAGGRGGSKVQDHQRGPLAGGSRR